MSASSPLVTAIIPVHNGGAFVAEAIESVLGQTYEPMECLVVDDGSTDHTLEILRAFGKRIRSIRQSKRGPAAARNAGARFASGHLLAFLDADDIWEQRKIERQVNLLLQRPDLGLVYCGFYIADRDGRPLEAAPVADPSVALRNILLDESPSLGLGSTALIPREVFLEVGGFDESLRMCEDGDLGWRLAARFPIDTVPEPLVRYRIHGVQRQIAEPGFERYWKSVLDKAFGSRILPQEVQRLERRARTNLALMLAYLYRRDRKGRSALQVCHALWLSPHRTVRWIATSVRRRLGARQALRP
jgi:glycosyltransferase involved in cell wall biosynthesis